MKNKIQDKQNYIAGNCRFLGSEDYYLDPFIHRINKNRLEKKYNVSISCHSDYKYADAFLYNTGVKFSLGGTDFEKIEKDFLTACNKYGSFEKAILFGKVSEIFLKDSFQHVAGNEFKMTSNKGKEDLLYFLDYIVNGEIPEDYSKVYVLRTKYDINAEDFDVLNIEELNGISIKKFKNGKVIIKGLTDSQLSKIKEVQEFILSHRNI